MRLKLPFYMLFSFLLAGCIKNPVGDVNNICNVFIAHPQLDKGLRVHTSISMLS